MFFDQYPYLNLNDFNLDYILKTLKSLSEQLENFISLNTIKYANPIQWNITTQYEANTVVIDANDGTAYLSVKPVPSGVAISNTNYWTPIFTLNLLSANQNITLRDDGSNVLATFGSVVGDWLIWNGILYKVSRPINVNEAYVVGYNLDRYSVELFIKDYIAAIDNEIDTINNSITAIQTDITRIKHQYDTVAGMIADTSLSVGDIAVVKGYHSVNDGGAALYFISSVQSGFGHLLDNSLYANIIITDSMTPEQFGAYGDYTHDDTAAINNAVTYAKDVVFNKEYLLNTPIREETIGAIYVDVPDNRSLHGVGKIKINANNYDFYNILFVRSRKNVSIDGLSIIGDKSSHLTNTGQWGFGVAVYGSEHVSVKRCKISQCWGDAIYIGSDPDNTTNDVKYIDISDNVLDDCRRNAISIIRGYNLHIHNNTISNTSGQNPQAGIDIEPDNDYEIVDSVIIESNIFKNNTNYGVLIVPKHELSAGIYEITNVLINNNEITGNTCTAVRLVNNKSGATTPAGKNVVISNNNLHDCLTGVTIHNCICKIIGNTFANFNMFTNEYVIYCDTASSDDIFIENNIFDTLRATVSMVCVNNATLNFNNNFVRFPLMPVTIEYNYGAIITGNTFSAYYRNYQEDVIKFTGTNALTTIAGNNVYRRSSAAPLNFLNVVETLSAGQLSSIEIVNNTHHGATFSNITGYSGGNNYLNYALIV